MERGMTGLIDDDAASARDMDNARTMEVVRLMTANANVTLE